MYQKFILKNGKRVGPYWYKSVRVRGGRVKSVYLGRSPDGMHSEQYRKAAIPKNEPHFNELQTILFATFVILVSYLVAHGFSFSSDQSIVGYAVKDPLKDSLETVNVSLTISSNATYYVDKLERVDFLAIKGFYTGSSGFTLSLSQDTILYSLILGPGGIPIAADSPLVDSRVLFKDTQGRVISSEFEQREDSALVRIPAGFLEYAELLGYRNGGEGIFQLVAGDASLEEFQNVDGRSRSELFLVDLSSIDFDMARLQFRSGFHVSYCDLWDEELSLCYSSFSPAQENLDGTSELTVPRGLVAIKVEYDVRSLQTPFSFLCDRTCISTLERAEGKLFFSFLGGDLLVDALQFSGNNVPSFPTLVLDQTLPLSELPSSLGVLSNMSQKKSRKQKVMETLQSDFRKDPAETIVTKDRQVSSELFSHFDAGELSSGPNWVKRCDGSKCVHEIFSSPINLLDSDGTFKPFKSVVQVIPNGSNFLVRWRDNELQVSLVGVAPNQLELRDRADSIEWIYRYNLTNLETLPIAKITGNKDVLFSDTSVRMDDLEIDFKDLISTGFSIEPLELDKKSFAVGMERDYVLFNETIGDEIVIDPTIELADVPNVTVDGDVFKNNTGYYRTTNPETQFRVGRQGCIARPQVFRAFVNFNTSSVPDDVVVTELNLSIHQRKGATSQDDDGIIIEIAALDTATTSTSSNATDKQIFDDIESGPNYTSFVGGNNKAYMISLGASAIAVFQGNLTLEQFNIGLNNSMPNAETQDVCVPIESSLNRFNSTANTFVGSPTLIVTYDVSPPSITYNSPASDTNFTEVGNVILSVSVTDKNDNAIKEIVFLGTNGSGQTPLSSEIISVQLNVSNNSVVTYNWTAPVVRNQSGVSMLLHFDNRTEFGENTTFVYDFSGLTRNSTMSGAVWNYTDGKVGGAYFFDGANDEIAFGDLDYLIGTDHTYLAWLKPGSVTGNAVIFHKLDTTAQAGIALARVGSDLRVFINSQLVGTAKIAYANYFSLNTYVHFGFVVDASGNLYLYRDGVLVNSSTPGVNPAQSNNNIQFLIGQNGNLDYRGMVDEFVVFNKTLSGDEINNYYRLRSGFHSWVVNASTGETNQTTGRNVRIDRIPNITSVTLTPDPSNTTDALKCSFIIIDDLTLTGLQWSLDFFNLTGPKNFGEVNTTQVADSPLANGSTITITGSEARVAKNETWKCGVIPFDTLSNGTQVNSSVINVFNSPPRTPGMLIPGTLNQTIDVRPTFIWNATDADDDVLNYTLNITCVGGCSGDDLFINATTANFEIPRDLGFYHDDGFRYLWSVRAIDGQNDTAFNTTYPTFNITVLVAMSLVNSTVAFPGMTPGTTDDTLTPPPYPILIQNDGNAKVDINISSNQSLFNTVGLGASNYQFKFGNRSELNSFNQSLTTIAFTNMEATNLSGIKFLNFSDSTDLAELDINITVPGEEGFGVRNSTIFLTAWYAGRI